MDKTKIIGCITVLLALTACSGSDFTATRAGVSGAAGAAGDPESGGAAGTPVQDGGSGAAGEIGTGGTGGSSGTGATGGSSGSGGQSGAGSSGSGGTGAAGGSSGSGGQGGAAGGDACSPQPCANDGKTCGEVPDGCGGMAKCLHACSASETCQANACVAVTCTEYSYTEITQLCQGNCGGLAKKCTPNDYFNCVQYDSGNQCLVYQWCQTGANQAGTCEGCTRQTAYDIGMDQATPFAYFCPSTFDDKIQDEGETDVDCGGPHNVRKCAPGKCSAGHCVAGKGPSYSCSMDSDCSQACQQDSDCSSQACVGGKCANSSKPTIGCTWDGDTANGPQFMCANDVQGCVRTPGGDSVSCGSTPGKPYLMTCNQGQSLAAAGCVQPGAGPWWCCAYSPTPP